MSIDPKILKRMQSEDAFLQSQTRGSRRVKLNRGQNWIVRFLPAQMGPEGLFFARIARHWLNKLPIICPRNTAPDYGGDPECDCPVCTVAEELNDSPNDAVSKIGYSSRANPQFLTYCVVWEKDGVPQPMSEILNPYEFWHYRSTWEELKGFYVAGGRKCPDSVLDYAQGNDFSVNKTAKGMRLDKQDSSPIFDLKEPKYNEWIKKIESALKTPKVQIPTAEQMQVFAAKVEEAAHRGVRGAGDDRPPRGSRYDDEEEEASFRRSSRRSVDEEDGAYEPPSRPAARSAAPARRSAPAPVEGEDDGDLGPQRSTRAVDEEVTPRRSARTTSEVEEVRPRRAAASQPEELPEEPEESPAPRRSARAAQETEASPVRRSAPSARRAAPPAEDPEPEPESTEGEPEPEAVDEPAPARATGRGLAPTARRAAAPEAAASTPQGEAEDEDPLPEDDRDPVPPAPKRGAAAAADTDAPPVVARRGGQGAAIASRLSKLPRGA